MRKMWRESNKVEVVKEEGICIESNENTLTLYIMNGG